MPSAIIPLTPFRLLHPLQTQGLLFFNYHSLSLFLSLNIHSDENIKPAYKVSLFLLEFIFLLGMNTWDWITIGGLIFAEDYFSLSHHFIVCCSSSWDGPCYFPNHFGRSTGVVIVQILFKQSYC